MNKNLIYQALVPDNYRLKCVFEKIDGHHMITIVGGLDIVLNTRKEYSIAFEGDLIKFYEADNE